MALHWCKNLRNLELTKNQGNENIKTIQRRKTITYIATVHAQNKEKTPVRFLHRGKPKEEKLDLM